MVNYAILFFWKINECNTSQQAAQTFSFINFPNPKTIFSLTKNLSLAYNNLSVAMHVTHCSYNGFYS